MSDQNDQDTAPSPRRSLTVVVSHMPQKADKPLLKDTNRILALAAFLFSVVTGLFAIYQTWTNSTQATIENVSKLTAQYYEGQGKLAQLNSTQVAYSNLLRTTLRSTALRATSQATLVKSDIDDGTWLALAQINDNENNLNAARIAWTAALDNTKDLTVHVFGSRGLAANLLLQGGNTGAEKAFAAAIEAVFANKFKGAENPYLPYYIGTSTESYWLGLHQTPDCTFVSSHYDKSLTYIAEAYQTAKAIDWNYENELLGFRPTLSSMRKAREGCSPVNEELLRDDDCYAIADVVDNAPFGFAVYRGAPVTPGQSDSDLWSRYYLPEVVQCLITSNSRFHCEWPENDEEQTASRAKLIAGKLLACKNFATVGKTESFRETATRAVNTITLSPTNRATIKVIRTHWKPSDKNAEEWTVILEVG